MFISGTMNEISSPLIRYRDHNYSTLFTKEGGYLFNQDRYWSIKKESPKNLPLYFAEIAEALIFSQAFDKIPNTQAFIQRFNVCRTEAIAHKILSTQVPYIYFNSKHPDFYFLSNFFPTLILFKHHSNPDKLFLYPSSENLYQAHKVADIYKRTSQEERKEQESNSENLDSFFNQIAVIDASTAKKLAFAEVEDQRSPDELARFKYQLMKNGLCAKFKCNPELYRLLQKTKPLELIENTNDRFWGSKKPGDPELKKNYLQAVSSKSTNVLGRILMEIRDNPAQ